MSSAPPSLEGSQLLVEGTVAISSLLLLSNGELAIGFAEGTIQILDLESRTFKSWKVESGDPIETLRGHTLSVLSIRECPNDCLVSGSRDGTIKFWDLLTGTCIRTITLGKSAVFALEVLANYQLLGVCLALSNCASPVITILDPSGECIDTLEGHNDPLSCFRIVRNHYLISGSFDNTIRIWDLLTKKSIHTLKGHGSYVCDLAIFEHDHFLFLASASNDHTIKIWNLSKLLIGTSGTDCIKTLTEHTAAVLSLQAWNEYLVSGSADGTIKIWNPFHDLHHELIQTIKIYTDPIPEPIPVLTPISDLVPVVRDLNPSKPKPEPPIRCLQISGDNLISSALGTLKTSNLPALLALPTPTLKSTLPKPSTASLLLHTTTPSLKEKGKGKRFSIVGIPSLPPDPTPTKDHPRKTRSTGSLDLSLLFMHPKQLSISRLSATLESLALGEQPGIITPELHLNSSSSCSILAAASPLQEAVLERPTTPDPIKQHSPNKKTAKQR